MMLKFSKTDVSSEVVISMTTGAASITGIHHIRLMLSIGSIRALFFAFLIVD